MSTHTGRLGVPRSAFFVVANIEAGEEAQENSATAASDPFQSRRFFVLTPKIETEESAYDANRTTIWRGANIYG